MHAVETTTDRRLISGGHTAAGHGLTIGVFAVGFNARLVTAHTLVGVRRGVVHGAWAFAIGPSSDRLRGR